MRNVRRWSGSLFPSIAREGIRITPQPSEWWVYSGGNVAEARLHCVELRIGQPHATTSKTNSHSFFPEQTEMQSRNQHPNEKPTLTKTHKYKQREGEHAENKGTNKHPCIERPVYYVLSTVPVCLMQSNNAPPCFISSQVSRTKKPPKGQRRQRSPCPADIETHFSGGLEESVAICTRQRSKRSRVTTRRQSAGEFSPATDVIWVELDRSNFNPVDFGLRGCSDSDRGDWQTVQEAVLPFVLLCVYVRECIFVTESPVFFFWDIYIFAVVWSPLPHYNFYHIIRQGLLICAACLTQIRAEVTRSQSPQS